jgi:two-component system chemotaxis response regulator CheB
MDKIRVMIVEDSRVAREFLEMVIATDSRLEVVASVASGEDALRVIHRARPHIVSMDIRLPGMTGLEATERIMAVRPTPIVVVSASVEADDLKISMNALRAGALAVVEKPAGSPNVDYSGIGAKLCEQLVLMSQIRVIRQRIKRDVSFIAEPPFEAPKSAAAKRPISAGQFKMVAIAASTGGPTALHQVLTSIGRDFPLPIVLVQHMTPTFMDGFVSWLTAATQLDIAIAKEGDIPAPGRVYVAPAERHLRVDGTRLRLCDGPPVNAQRPSGTVLFESLAKSLGPRSLAIQLTGMGSDGAEGLKSLRLAGGYTIAEDESTAIVYGMPGAAVRLGAVCESVPLGNIGRRVKELSLFEETVP